MTTELHPGVLMSELWEKVLEGNSPEDWIDEDDLGVLLYSLKIASADSDLRIMY